MSSSSSDNLSAVSEAQSSETHRSLVLWAISSLRSRVGEDISEEGLKQRGYAALVVWVISIMSEEETDQLMQMRMEERESRLQLARQAAQEEFSRDATLCRGPYQEARARVLQPVREATLS